MTAPRAAEEIAATTPFAERVRDVLNGGALCLMLSIGHRTGLFDVMAALGPAGSAAIAGEAGLDERYVREWLAALVCGGIVAYDPAGPAYHLSAEHVPVLTRGGAAHDLAQAAQWIPVLGAAEDELLACFERGGGVPPAAFGRFQAVMAEQSEHRARSGLLDEAIDLVPGLRAGLGRGIDVLDVGCGSGAGLQHLASRHRRSRFVGYDVAPEAIAAARARAAEQGLANLAFELRDAADLREGEAYDLVTAMGVLPTQARPQRLLEGVARALRPGGVLIVQGPCGTGRLEEDARQPLAPFLYTLSCMHTISVARAAEGPAHGAMWDREAVLAALREAGFEKVELHVLPRDPTCGHYVVRRA